MRVGLIGAGRMGLPIAHRLLGAGHALTVYDIADASVRELTAGGARRAPSAADAASDAELTLISLPRPEIVEAVVLGEGGALAACATGALLIDISTDPPALSRALAAAGQARGVAVLDAPISGGPLGAAAGTLAVMVGGDAAAVERATPVLAGFGATIRHLGPAGAGQAAKLANQLLAAAQMAAIAEAVALAAAEGVDLTRLYEVVTGASGDSSVLRQRYPVPGVLERAPASREWAALFTTDLLVKDLDLALGAAAGHGLDFPVGTLARERFGAAQEAGWGELDYSSVARLMLGG